MVSSSNALVLGSINGVNDATASVNVGIGTATPAYALDVGHPRIGVTIDTFHANIEERDIVEAIGLLGPFLKHLHASENDRGLLGRGHVDFPKIVRALRESDYDGYVMIEGFGYNRREKRAPGYLWADVGISPEALAQEGLKYFRSLF